MYNILVEPNIVKFIIVFMNETSLLSLESDLNRKLIGPFYLVRQKKKQKNIMWDFRLCFDSGNKTQKQNGKKTKLDLGVIKLSLLYDFCFG